MARTGRRPGATQTREEILRAAREQFAEFGYDGATIRGIARAAGVDPALVHHYFGAKEQVFVAAMRLPFNPAEKIPAIIAEHRDDPAEAIIRFFLGVWDAPETREPLLALIRSAAGHEDAAAVVQGFMNDVIVHRIAEEFGFAPLRAAMIGSQLFGLVLMRYVVGVEVVRTADAEQIVAIYAPAIRAVIEGGDA
ncbi:AcrR family transcriptional regulator [Nocardiopsis mwathae]|uniref:AcrR family transcriptional regulator n=1 Tax=Nocardiopsis mwathae TaxID=1472723 RepID=A0A7X0D806_9ACTN|nr:TetR family transcriptional regulator [Nocardiopsis mwathae]MBB6175038.1 AcrR family transcriptional regulator [Nocardiopsis mwathae]